MARCLTIDEISKSFCKREAAEAEFAVQYYNSIHKVPPYLLEQLGCESHFFFSADYWKTYELSFGSQMQFQYAVVLSEGEPIMFAPFQIIHFKGSNVADAEEGNTLWSKIKTISTRLAVSLVSLRLLVAGNTFLTGELAFFLKTGIKLNGKIAQAYFDTVTAIAQKENLNGLLIKDFYPETAKQLEFLEQNGFLRFEVNPNMEMDILSEWKTMRDYEQALSSKYRIRYHKAKDRAAALQIKDFDETLIAQHQTALQAMMDEVVNNSNFKLDRPDIGYVISLQRNFSENFYWKGVFRENELIGFYSAYLDNKNLNACFVGMNKKYLKEHDLYLNILFKLIELSVAQGAEKLILGRTAMEIKSSIGALPKQMFLYVKHVCPVRNFLVHYAIKTLTKNPEWTLRKPFKNA